MATVSTDEFLIIFLNYKAIYMLDLTDFPVQVCTSGKL